MGGDEGGEWYDVALIFPSGGIYHISFNNAKSFRGHCRTSQPFRKGLMGLSRPWTGPVWGGMEERGVKNEWCLQQGWWRDSWEDGLVVSLEGWMRHDQRIVTEVWEKSPPPHLRWWKSIIHREPEIKTSWAGGLMATLSLGVRGRWMWGGC